MLSPQHRFANACDRSQTPMPPRATADVDREQAAVANDRTAPAVDDPVAVSIELQGSCRAVDHTQGRTEVSALELAEVLEGFGVVHQPARSPGFRPGQANHQGIWMCAVPRSLTTNLVEPETDNSTGRRADAYFQFGIPNWAGKGVRRRPSSCRPQR